MHGAVTTSRYLSRISPDIRSQVATMAVVTRSAVSSQKAAFAGRVAPVRPQVVIACC